MSREYEPVELIAEANNIIYEFVYKRIEELELYIHESITDKVVVPFKEFKEKVWEVNGLIGWVCGEDEKLADSYSYQFDIIDGKLILWQGKDN